MRSRRSWRWLKSCFLASAALGLLRMLETEGKQSYTSRIACAARILAVMHMGRSRLREAILEGRCESPQGGNS